MDPKDTDIRDAGSDVAPAISDDYEDVAGGPTAAAAGGVRRLLQSGQGNAKKATPKNPSVRVRLECEALACGGVD